jgi:hypothetical protein
MKNKTEIEILTEALLFFMKQTTKALENLDIRLKTLEHPRKTKGPFTKS